jgi:type I restriction enzyme R subunit
VAALRDAVNRGGNGQILLSTIFKFAGSKEPSPNSGNWIVLVDECHRTHEKDLGAFLQATLPEAHFYGFTGTPIKSTDKDTYARFSVAGEGYLDK